MGYNKECFLSDCQYNCCGYSGMCVLDPKDCYYYYQPLSPGEITFIVLLGMFVLALALICISNCKCKCHKKQQDPIQQENERQNANNSRTSIAAIHVYPRDQTSQRQPSRRKPSSEQLTNIQPFPCVVTPYGQPIIYPGYNGILSPAYLISMPMGHHVCGLQQHSTLSF